MATRPARLLTGYGGYLKHGYDATGVLLVGAYPDVETGTPPPEAAPVGPLFRPAPRRPEITDDELEALLVALLVTA